jgi:hypothetical protein
MIRFARYLTAGNGRNNEEWIRVAFKNWFCGPSLKRDYPFKDK